MSTSSAPLTTTLPANPDLSQLRRQAKDLQQAVRTSDPSALALIGAHLASVPDAGATFPLRLAQLAVARQHGFASWARMKRHVELVNALTRRPDTVAVSTDPAREFLRLACLTYGDDHPDRRTAARALLATDPGIAGRDVWTAAATASVPDVQRHLATDATAAQREGGPFGWEPLVYLAYARHDEAIAAEAVRATAELLIEAGADPDVGYFWHGLPTPFTALTGAFGGGEQGPVAQPPHPQAQVLARALLTAGADPNDGQTLYNRMYEPADDHLDLLFGFGLGTGDGGPWRARLGEVLPSPTALLRDQLRWAVTHHQVDRVRLLLDHGVDAHQPFADGQDAATLAALSGDAPIGALFEGNELAGSSVRI